MERLDEILKRIEDLYGDEDVDIKQIQAWMKKYPDRVKAWEDGLKNYLAEDVLNAINEYWRFKNSEKKPRLVHIQAILNTNKIENLQAAPANEEQSKLARLAELTKQRIEQEVKEKWGA